MSQVFDALQRSGIGLPGLEPTAESSREVDTAGLDALPSFQIETLPEHRLVTWAAERSVAAERIRMLGVRLRQFQQQRAAKTLLITSSIKDEGKSILSANIAISLAKAKQRILLIDGDHHQGSLAQIFGTGRSPGLTEWWYTRNPILSYIRRVHGLPLWFLPSGEPLVQAVEMLQSRRISEMLVQVTSWFDWVIIDSPPFAPVADSAIWTGLTDATLLLVRLGKTPKKVLDKVVGALDPRKLVGVVLNECADPHRAYYAQYYKGIPNVDGR